MRKYLNNHAVPLSMAVFLANDTYDHDDTTVSVTKLIKPVRQIVLGGRVPQTDALVDVSGLVKSRMGTAIHDGIENAWVNHKNASLLALGYPQRVVDRIVVNPDPEEVSEDHIPVYLERRSYKTVMGYTISGKFDFVAEGRVEDFKSTSTMAWSSTNKQKDYQLQGSMYRWLNQDIITDDMMNVTFLFTDFQAFRAKSDPTYPPHATPNKTIPLLSVAETEAYVTHKLTQINRYKDAPEADLPYCNEHELWRKETVWKYYAKHDAKRATKDFKTDKQAAYLRLATDGGKGLVKEIPGEVIACKYCPAFAICTQKDALIADGSLKL